MALRAARNSFPFCVFSVLFYDQGYRRKYSSGKTVLKYYFNNACHVQQMNAPTARDTRESFQPRRRLYVYSHTFQPEF